MRIFRIFRNLEQKRANRSRQGRDNYRVIHIVAFVIVHLLPLLLLVFNPTLIDWIVCIAFYLIRMFFVTGGYHRYFSHRTFKTSRFFQFVLAFMAQTSMQKGALWWASNHRLHHRHSDELEDPHSMKQFGFIYSHLGWLFSHNFKNTRYNIIGDFAKFKELKWLNKYHLVPPLVLAALIFMVGGLYHVRVGSTETFWEGGMTMMLTGFVVSTVILYHATFSINSLMHLIGTRRYQSDDESRNNLVLAILTLGEGWHNNHHHYMNSARQGFFWWEVDITYYTLKLLSFFGLVWDIKPVPEKVKNAHLMPN